MLSDAERQALGADGEEEELLVSKPSNNEGKGLSQKVIFLSAILYFSPDKWTLWLNDQVVHQQGEFEGMLLKGVSPNYVVFNFGGGEDVLLKPNQSLVVKTGKVFEGDRRSLLKPSHSLDKAPETSEHKDQGTTSVQGLQNE